jgi:hypothetical protein
MLGIWNFQHQVLQFILGMTIISPSPFIYSITNSLSIALLNFKVHPLQRCFFLPLLSSIKNATPSLALSPMSKQFLSVAAGEVEAKAEAQEKDFAEVYKNFLT